MTLALRTAYVHYHDTRGLFVRPTSGIAVVVRFFFYLLLLVGTRIDDANVDRVIDPLRPYDFSASIPRCDKS